MKDFVLPATLSTPVENLWQEFQGLCATRQIDLEPLVQRVDEIKFIWACSEFIAKNCLRYPEQFITLWHSGRLWQAENEISLLQQVASEVTDELQLMKVLRQQRRWEMVRIAWRDLAGYAGLQQTTRDLSAFADGAVQVALDWHYRWLCEQFGTPMGRYSGEPQQLVVLGMGKLGAHELNFSSDIDLIFAYAEGGETEGGRRSLSNEEFFRRLGQKLIQALDNLTEDGQVFRVDMRLRPFGDSGPLAISFDAMEQYYQLHGREWERYAMVKARVIAGDQAAGKELMAMLRPFVYRRYIDYGAFDSLRDMKRMIADEVRRKGMTDNVKLGPGGIREVEFIGQVFQLIRGGRLSELRAREILTILQRLEKLDCLPDYVVAELTAAYLFLRNTEHRIQEYRDQQSHDLPEDELGRLRLAVSMGFSDWVSFSRELETHRKRVQQHFDQAFSAPQAVEGDSAARGYSEIWHGDTLDETHQQRLEHTGYRAPQQVFALLHKLRISPKLRSMSQEGGKRLDRLMPLLMAACASVDNQLETMERLIALIETIAKRSAYISLLVENPMALSQLVKLCSVSSWISKQLQQYPLLLDELLDPRALYAPPDKTGLEQELAMRLQQLDEQDLEQQMEALRQFKQTNVLRVAAADISNAIPLMVVSDHLSWIAEVLLEKVAEIAWNTMVAKHGSPVCRIDDEECDLAFAVIAYGKLGGIELGYSSDLDLVFLHAGASGATAGDKPLDNAVFFARLGQRIIHIITAHTPSGVLYEADMRLRPSGASGLLVSSVSAFAEYQRNDAWTWEHQALVRARVIVGDDKVRRSFEQVRQEILSLPRDQSRLQAEVKEMRSRMREQLEKKIEGKFDLKQGIGGIADIEFMVQYVVLNSARQNPQLCRYTDNIRILQTAGEIGLLTAEEVQRLCDAYRSYRAEAHRMALLEQPAVTDLECYTSCRDGVARIWQQLLGE